LATLSESDDAVEGIRNILNERDETGLGLDVGVTYHPFVDNYWHPAVAMSILNMGTIDMNDAYGGQPMTVNFGLSITPEFPILDKFVVAVDYIDMFNNITYKTSTEPNSPSYEESDFTKRIRAGVSVGLFDTWLMSTTLNGGLYQGAYTAGLDIELLIFKINAATYQEEIGTGDTSIPDRRYMARIGIGW